MNKHLLQAYRQLAGARQTDVTRVTDTHAVEATLMFSLDYDKFCEYQRTRERLSELSACMSKQTAMTRRRRSEGTIHGSIIRYGNSWNSD